MIELDDDMVAFWFVTLPPYDDFMAAVKKSGVMEYRFRYSNADQPDPFDERDVKHWYHVDGPTEHLIGSMSYLTRMLAEKAGGERWELLRGAATFEQFMAEFVQLPFLHMKVELDEAKLK